MTREKASRFHVVSKQYIVDQLETQQSLAVHHIFCIERLTVSGPEILQLDGLWRQKQAQYWIRDAVNAAMENINIYIRIWVSIITIFRLIQKYKLIFAIQRQEGI